MFHLGPEVTEHTGTLYICTRSPRPEPEGSLASQQRASNLSRTCACRALNLYSGFTVPPSGGGWRAPPGHYAGSWIPVGHLWLQENPGLRSTGKPPRATHFQFRGCLIKNKTKIHIVEFFDHIFQHWTQHILIFSYDLEYFLLFIRINHIISINFY